MTIFDDPIDPDTEVPRKIVSREEALSTLQAMVFEGKLTEGAAQRVWTAFLAPLYDARALGQRWSRGRCSCGAVHPTWRSRNSMWAEQGHRMWCRWYVGPLEHRTRDERSSFITGDPMIECTCGRTYHKWLDDDWTKRNVCPDILFIWRGPKEVNDMGGKEHPILEPRPEPDPEPENV